MFGLGAPELLIVFGVVVLLFGGAKLPQLARSLGQAQKEFKAGTEHEPDPELEPAPAKPKAAKTVSKTVVTETSARD